ncbi:hypothetical protein BC936DRAFT_149251, partial [Jimgerdemannia flammicorona]
MAAWWARYLKGSPSPAPVSASLRELFIVVFHRRRRFQATTTDTAASSTMARAPRCVKISTSAASAGDVPASQEGPRSVLHDEATSLQKHHTATAIIVVAAASAATAAATATDDDNDGDDASAGLVSTDCCATRTLSTKRDWPRVCRIAQLITSHRQVPYGQGCYHYPPPPPPPLPTPPPSELAYPPIAALPPWPYHQPSYDNILPSPPIMTPTGTPYFTYSNMGSMETYGRQMIIEHAMPLSPPLVPPPAPATKMTATNKAVVASKRETTKGNGGDVKNATAPKGSNGDAKASVTPATTTPNMTMPTITTLVTTTPATTMPAMTTSATTTSATTTPATTTPVTITSAPKPSFVIKPKQAIGRPKNIEIRLRIRTDGQKEAFKTVQEKAAAAPMRLPVMSPNLRLARRRNVLAVDDDEAEDALAGKKDQTPAEASVAKVEGETMMVPMETSVAPTESSVTEVAFKPEIPTIEPMVKPVESSVKVETRLEIPIFAFTSSVELDNQKTGPNNLDKGRKRSRRWDVMPENYVPRAEIQVAHDDAAKSIDVLQPKEAGPFGKGVEQATRTMDDVIANSSKNIKFKIGVREIVSEKDLSETAPAHQNSRQYDATKADDTSKAAAPSRDFSDLYENLSELSDAGDLSESEHEMDMDIHFPATNGINATSTSSTTSRVASEPADDDAESESEASSVTSLSDSDSDWDDDASSLQSDDDVLGPWVELGLIATRRDPRLASWTPEDSVDTPDTEEVGLQGSMEEAGMVAEEQTAAALAGDLFLCEECAETCFSLDRSPWDVVELCGNCFGQLVPTINGFGKGDECQVEADGQILDSAEHGNLEAENEQPAQRDTSISNMNQDVPSNPSELTDIGLEQREGIPELMKEQSSDNLDITPRAEQCPPKRTYTKHVHRKGEHVHHKGEHVHRKGEHVHRKGEHVHRKGEHVHRKGKHAHRKGEHVHRKGEHVHRKGEHVHWAKVGTEQRRPTKRIPEQFSDILEPAVHAEHRFATRRKSAQSTSESTEIEPISPVESVPEQFPNSLDAATQAERSAARRKSAHRKFISNIRYTPAPHQQTTAFLHHQLSEATSSRDTTYDPQVPDYYTTGAFLTRSTVRMLGDAYDFDSNSDRQWNYLQREQRRATNRKYAPRKSIEPTNDTAMPHEETLTPVEPESSETSTMKEISDEQISDCLPTVASSHKFSHKKLAPTKYSPVPNQQVTALSQSQSSERYAIQDAQSFDYFTTGAFLTRSTVRKLADAFGFEPNPYGYRYGTQVAVLALDGKWDEGKLTEMRQSKVRVHFKGYKKDIYDQWIMMGSRRLRVLSNDVPIQAPKSSRLGYLFEVEENPEFENEAKLRRKQQHHMEPESAEPGPAEPESAETAPKQTNERFLRRRRPQMSLQSVSGHEQTGGRRRQETSSRNKSSFEMDNDTTAQSSSVEASSYRTTGAFMTRRALRQLSGPSGFGLNLYGYEFNQHIKVLNLDKKWYEARLVALENGRVRIHYCGVDAFFDEWIPEGSRRIKVTSEADLEDGVCREEIEQPQTKDEEWLPISRPGKRRRRERSDALTSKTSKPERAEKRQRREEIPDEVVTEKEPDSNLEPDDWVEREQNLRRSLRRLGCDRSEPRDAPRNPNELRARLRPGSHLEARDRNKEWLAATVVAVRGYRVLVHYEGYPQYFDEWMDINSERLRIGELEEGEEEEEMEATPQYQGKKRQRQSPSQCQDSVEAVEPEAEYFREDMEGVEWEESANWQVYCNQCHIMIKQFRYYCTYCEVPSEGSDYQSFELCLWCFSHQFPEYHHHPRSSFAVQSIMNTDELGPVPVKGELVSTYEKDVVDVDYQSDTEDQELLRADMPLDSDKGYAYLKRWSKRKICSFCNDDDTSGQYGGFIGPFVIATMNRRGEEKKRSFWVHDACARYSPEVFVTKEDEWYNVTAALRRGRGMKCAYCKEKGATVGCFDPKCSRSFHLPCTQKPVLYFQNGVIFWCPTHEALFKKKGRSMKTSSDATDVPNRCKRSCGIRAYLAANAISRRLTCVRMSCFENKFPEDHEHDRDFFEETSVAIIKEMEAEKKAEAARAKQEVNATVTRKPLLFPKGRRKNKLYCSYCWTESSDRWRKGYNGVLMCEGCFERTSLDLAQSDEPKKAPLVLDANSADKYAASIEDYTHQPYLTRTSCSANKFDDTRSDALYLTSYEPGDHQLFSLAFDSSYFDIPGRAPRWATHSGTDYHGTWLPQTVRRPDTDYFNDTRTEQSCALPGSMKGFYPISWEEARMRSSLSYCNAAYLIITLCSPSRCCGVDINPAAVALSQRNCSFATPPGFATAEHRPIIVQADSRNLSGSLFEDESYDHILSHPPYKDCVAYSTHIDGDLSRFPTVEEFEREMTKVVNESWRLLKMGRRLTLGIGDNREHCFYIPVSFQMMRQYIDCGFELEELVVKRQRYCSAFGLGTYLCVQFDFLCFTHEFIATFKKVKREGHDCLLLQVRFIFFEPFPTNNPDDVPCDSHVKLTYVRRAIPQCPIARKSVVMGTVWVFKPTREHSFADLCVSRMVERFGKDDANWEEVRLEFMSKEVGPVIHPGDTIEDQQGEERGWYDRITESHYCRERRGAIVGVRETPTQTYPGEQPNAARFGNARANCLPLPPPLHSQGLISELSEDSDDVSHHQHMISKPPLPWPAPTSLRLVPHVPNTALESRQVPLYRTTIIQIAHEAAALLPTSGMFVVGTQDVRGEDGRLWPLGLLVLEDINREIGEGLLKLREMVTAVPEGYQKDRKKVLTKEDAMGEGCVLDEEATGTIKHLPIVHAIYLIFVK